MAIFFFINLIDTYSIPTMPQDTLALAQLIWDRASNTFSISVNSWLTIVGLILLIIPFFLRLKSMWPRKNFEIDEAEIGIGNSKLKFKPSNTDQQVAYAIWVELSTRKIGLPIDLNHDVIVEIYDSWHTFFSVTRELIKTIPVSRMRDDSTRIIVRLSIEVLNEGLRPHLTHWQARFRWWYENELKKSEEAHKPSIDPQTIQAKFPKYGDLKTEMENVNQRLIKYRNKMFDLLQH